ncbi:MAG: 5'-nucleotidase C-terminal domain-containing protein, partial [Anaerolinea sp.]|nr:5'-nucleotidase C-terminal domain-containing protein [Anaerolinea sp.]
HLDKGQSTGSHPYAAGLRWSLDLSQPRGQRFASVQVQDKTSGQWQALEPQRRYVLVTSDYLASGRDGYATLAAASRGDSTVNTYQLYTQTFVDDIVARGTLTRPAGGEMSHQQVTTRDGRRLP